MTRVLLNLAWDYSSRVLVVVVCAWLFWEVHLRPAPLDVHLARLIEPRHEGGFSIYFEATKGSDCTVLSARHWLTAEDGRPTEIVGRRGGWNRLIGQRRSGTYHFQRPPNVSPGAYAYHEAVMYDCGIRTFVVRTPPVVVTLK